MFNDKELYACSIDLSVENENLRDFSCHRKFSIVDNVCRVDIQGTETAYKGVKHEFYHQSSA